MILILVTNLLLKFLLTYSTIPHTPRCRIPEMTNFPVYTCVYLVLFLGSPSFMNKTGWVLNGGIPG